MNTPTCVPRILRGLTFGLVVGLVALAPACSFSDFWAEYAGREQDDDAPAAGVVPTNTPWAYATPTPTALPTGTPYTYRPPATSTPRPAPTRTPTPAPTPSPTPLPSLLGELPAASDIPGDLEVTYEDADLTPEEVAAETTDPAAHLQRLRDWGYRRGAARELALEDPGMKEYLSELLGFQVSVLEFGSPGQARAAMDFQRVYAKAQADWDLDDEPAPDLGDASAALTGTAEYEGTDVQVAAIFVQQGNRLYRFIAVAGLYDPWDDAVAVARGTVK